MRLISLCPSLTELVFDLGRGDDLIGRTKFCVHPADRVGPVEKVGGTKNPKIARIVELAPDLVLMNEEENRREDADALRAAGIHIHASMPRNAADTAAMVRSIGAAIERREDAERIAADIEARSARVRATAAGLPNVTFAYLIWREPLMAANGDTFVDALLSEAGGRNVFGTWAERYPTIAAKELVSENPQVVLLSTEPFPFAERHAEELAGVTGIPRDRFAIVDGELLSWHGSRTPRGIDYAEAVIGAARARSTLLASPTSPDRWDAGR
jgi:iron complex transport system substrate-binding protein